jgi:outer membrane protein assembly factor BamA
MEAMMRRSRFVTALLACAFLPALLRADCPGDHDNRFRKASGLLITDFSISGTHTLSSEELLRITSQLTGYCFDEDTEELAARIRASFQDQGYMEATVKNLHIKPGDPLATPKPVTLGAEVVEGRRFKVGAIEFVGNHVFSVSKLRSDFSLRKGDLFARAKIATGLEGVCNLMSPMVSLT